MAKLLSDKQMEEQIHEWQEEHAAGTLRPWQISRLEPIPGWEWNAAFGSSVMNGSMPHSRVSMMSNNEIQPIVGAGSRVAA